MEEDKINEAQVVEIKKDNLEAQENINEENNDRKWFSDFRVEAILFLVLGILVGFALKTEAVKKITMGFDDGKMRLLEKGYDINELEKIEIQKRIEKMSEESGDEAGEGISPEETTGGNCQ